MKKKCKCCGKKITEEYELCDKCDEEINKKLYMKMWIILFSSIVIFIGLSLLLGITLGEGLTLNIIELCLTIIFIGIALYCSELNGKAGYFKCQYCEHNFKVSFFSKRKVLLAPHIGNRTKLTCPNCGEKTWCIKVMSRKDRIL